MPPKSVVSLLTEQSEETLVGMRDALHDEIERLQIEERLVDEALSKRYRRGSRTASRSGNNGRRPVKRQDVLELVRLQGRPVTPAETRELLAHKGVEVSPNSIRNHLVRLVADGKLVSLGNGLYTVLREDAHDEKSGPDERVSAGQTEIQGDPATSWGS